MQWAEGGSLDDFIDVRMGRASAGHPTTANENLSADPDPSALSRGARIRAFRAMQHAAPEERERLRREMSGLGMRGGRNNVEWKPIHLLSADEVKSLFKDVVEGLAFLVGVLGASEGRANVIALIAQSIYSAPRPQTR